METKRLSVHPEVRPPAAAARRPRRLSPEARSAGRFAAGGGLCLLLLLVVGWMGTAPSSVAERATPPLPPSREVREQVPYRASVAMEDTRVEVREQLPPRTVAATVTSAPEVSVSVESTTLSYAADPETQALGASTLEGARTSTTLPPDGQNRCVDASPSEERPDPSMTETSSTPDRRPLPLDDVAAKPPAKIVGAKPPAKTVGAKPPVKIVGAKPHVKTVGAKPPAKTVGAKPPAKTVGAKPPVKTVGAKPPAKTVGAKPPVKTVAAEPSVRLLGRIRPPERQASQASVHVLLVDMSCGEAVQGGLNADNGFSFEHLRPGALYYIAAWQNIAQGEEGATTATEERLSWHQVIRVDTAGCFSIELSRENCDSEYSSDVLPASAVQAPGSGRRAELTRMGGNS